MINNIIYNLRVTTTVNYNNTSISTLRAVSRSRGNGQCTYLSSSEIRFVESSKIVHSAKAVLTQK